MAATETIISTYLEEQFLKMVLAGGSPVPLTSGTWVALFTSDPWKSGSGTEVSGAGYSRKQATDVYISDGIDYNTYVNSGSIIFDEATGDWGLVSYWGITTYSASMSASGLLFYGAFSTPKYVFNGDYLRIAPGDLSISLTGAYSPYLANMLLNCNLNAGIISGSYFSSPGSSIYLALYDGSGNEFSAADYERIVIANNWTNPVAGSVSNAISASFATAQSNWGVLVSVGIVANPEAPAVPDMAYNPDILYQGNLAETQDIIAGDIVKFGVNKLYIVSDGQEEGSYPD